MQFLIHKKILTFFLWKWVESKNIFSFSSLLVFKTYICEFLRGTPSFRSAINFQHARKLPKQLCIYVWHAFVALFRFVYNKYSTKCVKYVNDGFFFNFYFVLICWLCVLLLNLMTLYYFLTKIFVALNTIFSQRTAAIKFNVWFVLIFFSSIIIFIFIFTRILSTIYRHRKWWRW